MKGVPIKFRGRVFASNEVVFGDYITRKDGSCAIRVRDKDDLFNMHEYEIAVEKRSVAQLVGYDANGAEVYEGDTLVSAGGIDFTAELWAMGVNDLDADDIGGVFKFTLKVQGEYEK